MLPPAYLTHLGIVLPFVFNLPQLIVAKYSSVDLFSLQSLYQETPAESSLSSGASSTEIILGRLGPVSGWVSTVSCLLLTPHRIFCNHSSDDGHSHGFHF